MLSALFGNGVIAGVGLTTGVLAARILGPEGRGELAAIQLWPTFIGTVATLGLPEALVYYCAKEPSKSGRHFAGAVCIAAFSSLVFMTLGYFIIPQLIGTHQAVLIRSAQQYLWIVPLYAFVAMPIQAFRPVNFRLWNVLRIAPNALWLLVLLVSFSFRSSAPSSLAFRFLCVFACMLPLMPYLAWKYMAPPFIPTLRGCRLIVGYGVPTVASSVPQLLNLRLDQMMMVAVLPPQALGLYVVAVAWSTAVQPFLSAVGLVLFPSVASEADPVTQISTAGRGIRLGIAAGLCLSVLFSIITPFAIPLVFGGQYRAGIPAALILMLAAGIYGGNSVVEETLRGLGAPKSIMWAEFAGIFVTVISLILLLRPLDIVGAAIASLLGYLTVLIVAINEARKITAYRFRSLLWPTVEDLRDSIAKIRTVLGGVAARPRPVEELL
jgi:O-antigen/teichoic acid export membrane protein